MGHGSSWNAGAIRVATGMLVGLVLVAGAAQAKPWAKLAPAPLASDSAYAALSARPADSLGTDELSWVEVQRDWRAARKLETEPAGRSISEPEGTHRARPTDGRFAALASRPFASLTASERSWLVMENAAQRVERTQMSTGGTVALVVIVAALAAVAGVAWGAHAVVADLFGGH
jgi:hypothetical protein